MVELASLYLMKRDDNILEELHVLFSQRHSKSTNNTRQYIQQLCHTIEFIILVDQSIQLISLDLSDHLPPWHELCVEPMENVLQIFSFPWLL